MSIGRWVSKTDAIIEMDVSLSTLDRMIKSEKVVSHREGGHVFILAHGRAPPADRELLERALYDLTECEATASMLQNEVERLTEGLSRERRRAAELRDKSAQDASQARTSENALERQLREARAEWIHVRRAFFVATALAAVFLIAVIALFIAL